MLGGMHASQEEETEVQKRVVHIGVQELCWEPEDSQSDVLVKSIQLLLERPGIESPLSQGSLFGNLGPATHSYPGLPYSVVVKTEEMRTM